MSQLWQKPRNKSVCPSPAQKEDHRPWDGVGTVASQVGRGGQRPLPAEPGHLRCSAETHEGVQHGSVKTFVILKDCPMEKGLGGSGDGAGPAPDTGDSVAAMGTERSGKRGRTAGVPGPFPGCTAGSLQAPELRERLCFQDGSLSVITLTCTDRTRALRLQAEPLLSSYHRKVGGGDQ